MLFALALASAESPSEAALRPKLAAYYAAVERATAGVAATIPRLRTCQLPAARQLVVRVDLAKGAQATTVAVTTSGSAKVSAPCVEKVIQEAFTKDKPAVGREAVVVLDTVGAPRLDGDVALLGALGHDAIEAGMRGVMDLVGQCYVVGLAESPGLAGQLVVSFSVLPDGYVYKPEVKRTELWNATVEECVLRQVQMAHFADPEGEAIARVSYPFTFQPPSP